jgi:hypothetical protein
MAVARFLAGAREKSEPIWTDGPVVQTAGSRQVGPQDIPAGGYINALLVLVTLTTAGNAATVVFSPDAPFSFFDEFTILDPNGAPINGPMTGFEWYLANTLGGYRWVGDPTLGPEYSVVSGVGAGLGGSTTFLFRIPLAILGADGVGLLPNMNAAAAYKFRYTVAPSTSVYATPPTALGSYTIQVWAEKDTQPADVTPMGNRQARTPVGLGTMVQWTKQIFPLVAGSNSFRFNRVGNWIRNYALVIRDNSGVRNATNIGPQLRLNYDEKELVNLDPRIIRRYMQERSQLPAANLPTGVYLWDYTHDFDGHLGAELRDLWLPTTTATRIDLYVPGALAAGTLTLLTNDVVVEGEGVVV